MPSKKKTETPRAKKPAATKSEEPAAAKKKVFPAAKGKKPAAERVKKLDVPKTGKPPATKRTGRAKASAKPVRRAARTTADGHFVSVVMPTIGRPSLEPSKAAIARQTRPPDELVVVVDHDRRGPAWALNEGIRRAKGDLIAFSPDDGEPEEKWLESLVSAIDRHDADCAGGAYLESDPLLNEVRELHPLPFEETVDTKGYVGNGGSIIFKRSWLEECIEKDGYVYNEKFVVAEDWELIWRMRQRGLKVVYVPVKTRHLRRVTAKSYIRHQFYRGVGIAQLYKLQRKAGPGVAVQESLIWGQAGTRHGAKWITAFVQKAIGPFNWRQFSRGRYFWTHWLAEKFQGVGFLWGLIAN